MRGLAGVREVARWEVLRNIRSRSFLLGVIVTPLIGLLFAGIPALLAQVGRMEAPTFAVVDEIGAYESLAELLPAAEARLIPAADDATAAARLAAGEVDGYLKLDAAFVDTGVVHLQVSDPDARVPGGLRSALTRILQGRRWEAAGLSPVDAEYLLAPATVISAAPGPEPGGGAVPGEFQLGNMPLAIGTLVLLVILVITSGAMLVQSALQEKRDRMSEVVLSSIDALQLMAGKIIGQFVLGLLQLAAWAALGLPLFWFLFDFSIGPWVTLKAIPPFAVFLVLGYLLYAALFVGAGATMADIQSASNLQGLLIMLPFLPFLLVAPVVHNPGGLVARAGTFFPLTGPFIAVLRMGVTDVPAWELAAAAGILLAATVVVTRIAARIFRVGMLMYGKSASPAEVWRWLRTP